MTCDAIQKSKKSGYEGGNGRTSTFLTCEHAFTCPFLSFLCGSNGGFGRLVSEAVQYH